MVLRNAIPTERTTLFVPNSLSHMPIAELVSGTIHNREGDKEDGMKIFRGADDDFVSMVHVALKLRGDIVSHPGFKGVNVNKAAEIASVPQSVHAFLTILFGGLSSVDEVIENCDVEDPEILMKHRGLSTGQDLVFGICGNKKAPPRHTGLGLSLHEATRSKKLVELFYRAGHVINYNQIRQIDTGMAEATLKSMNYENRFCCATKYGRRKICTLLC